MSRVLKKFLFVALTVLVIVFALNFLIVPQWISQEIQKQFQAQNMQEGGLQISAEKIFVTSAIPLQIRMDNMVVGFQSLPLKISIPKILIYSGWGSEWYKSNWQWDTSITISQPQVRWALESTSSKKTSIEKAKVSSDTKRLEDSKWIQWASMYPYGSRASIEIEGGQILVQNPSSKTPESPKSEESEVQSVLLKDWSFQLEKISNVFDWQRPFTIKTQGRLEVFLTGWRVEVPFQLVDSPLFLTEDLVSSPEMELKVAGLASTLKGKSDLDQGSHQWDLKLNIPHIEKLPIPPQLLPPGQWFGGLLGDVRGEKREGSSWQVQAQFQTQEFRGNIEIQKEDLMVKGNLFAGVDFDLLYKDELLTIPRIQASSNWDNVVIKYKEFFQKPLGEALNFQVDGYFSDDFLVLKKVESVVAGIKAQLSGFVSPSAGKEGVLKLLIPKTSLQSLRTLIPMVSEYPVTGQLAVSAQLKGDFIGDPQSISVDANPIRLSQVKMTFNHRDDRQKIYLIGPMTADVAGVLKTQGQKIQAATLRSNVDFSGMEIGYKDLFEKPMGKSFKLNLAAGAEGENLVFKNSNLEIAKGKVRLDGHLSKPQQPRMKLKLKTEQLAIEDLELITEMAGQYKAKGVVDSELLLTGLYDFKKGVKESPIALSGNMDVHLQSLSYELPPSQTHSELPVEVENAKEAKALLPNWPVLARSDLQLGVKVSQAQFGKTLIKNSSFKAHYSKGGFSASGVIGDVFSGKAYIDRLRGQLLAPKSIYDGKLRLVNIDLKPAIAMLYPRWAEDVQGLASGIINFKMPLPGEPKWRQQLQSQGSLDVRRIHLSFLKLEKAINEALEKIPKVKLSPVKTESFQGDLESIYALKEDIIEFDKLHLRSSKNDELNLKGKIRGDKSMDMKGELSLVKPPIRGEVYLCNKDEKGRLILPIQVQGSWNSPSIGFASKTIEKLVANTLQCEIKKARAQASQKIEKELKKATQDLEKDLEKNLKDLFK